MKKILCLILALSMAAAMSGCGKKNEGSTEVETNAEEQGDVIAKVGGIAVTENDVEVYLGQIVPSVQQQTGSAPGWEKTELQDGKTARDMILDSVFDGIHITYAMYLKARETGLYSEADEKKFVDDEIDSQFGGDDKQFEDFLSESGLKEGAVRKFLGIQGASQAMIESYCSEEEAEDHFKNDYMCVKHILITFAGDGTGEDDADTLAKANAAYERAMAGESFEDLASELGQDPGLDVEQGYVFTDGEMVQEFEDASKALNVGEISNPVKTSYGYHVIKRYPLPEKGTETYDTYLANARYQLGLERFEQESDAKYEEWKNEYKLDMTDGAREKIDFSKYNSEN